MFDDDDINDSNNCKERITVNIQSTHCRVPLLHSYVHVERRDAGTGKGQPGTHPIASIYSTAKVLQKGQRQKLEVTCMHRVTVENPLQDVNLYNHNLGSVTSYSYLAGR